MSYISARGFWQRGDKAFFDVRIFNPFAKSHLPVKLKTLFAAYSFPARPDQGVNGHTGTLRYSQISHVTVRDMG